MSIYAFISLLASLTCLITGSFVYSLNPKEKLNKIFLWYCYVLFYWGFVEFMYRQAQLYRVADFWVTKNFLWPMVVPLLFHFILLFTEKEAWLKRKFTYWLIYLPAFIICYISSPATHFIVNGTVLEPWGYTYGLPQVVWVRDLIMTWVFVLSWASLFICYRYYCRTTDRNKKKQAFYTTVGFFVTIGSGCFTEAIPPMFHVRIPECTVAASAVQCVLMGYAILRYRLFVFKLDTAAVSIINTMTESLLLLNPEGKIQRTNHGVFNLLGYQENELLGKPFDFICDSGGDLGKNLKNHECNLKTKDGSRVPVLLSLSSIRDKRGYVSGIVCTANDIVERKAAEEELKRAYRDLKETHDKLVRSERMAALGEMAAMIGHELRNSLGVLRNSVYFLKAKLPELTQEQKVLKYMDIFEREIGISERVISDILTFSRIKQPVLQKKDINVVLAQTMERINLPDHIHKKMDLGKNLPQIMVDADQLMHVLTNIVNNAIEAMSRGGMLTIKTFVRDQWLVVAFIDTGEGVSGENLSRIFEPGFTTKTHGTGLGLAICEGIVALHNGKIEVESKVAQGTQISVYLPALS